MHSLKQFMGFLMMGSVGWILWILSARFSDTLIWILLGLWFLSLGLWFYGKFVTIYTSLIKKTAGIILFSACLAGAIFSFYYGIDETETPNQLNFKRYTQEAVDLAIAENKPVLINFTARWCITCQTNKKIILESSTVIDQLKAKNVELFEADWTHHDEIITKKLESYGQNSIPFMVFYPKSIGRHKAEPIFLSAILTRNKFLEVLGSSLDSKNTADGYK